MIDLIQETALKILRQSPDVVIRHKLKFEILCQQGNAQDVFSLDASQHVQTLANEQHDDGSWGRFHSQDSRRKQKIPTTELAVERALHLGLDPAHPILLKTANFIEHVLNQTLPFPDPPETNNRWETGKRLFLASTLSMIQPDHPLVLQEHSLWLSIAERAFQSGQYVQGDEIEAHAELTGASVKDSYLTLNGKYQLNLIGSQSGKLPAKLAKSIMTWVWERPDGIRYLGQPLKTPPGFKPEVVDHWLSSLALTLLRFPYVYHHTQHAIDWLLSQRTVDGYWDFGPCPRRSTFFPLSENWHNPKHRRFDWTTRVLSILADYHRCN
jgi:hypothetical protein